MKISVIVLNTGLSINEQNVLILSGDIIGTTTLKDQKNINLLYQQNHHMLVAQAKAMALCHEMVEGGKIDQHQIFLFGLSSKL